jgi:hypothetical protein
MALAFNDLLALLQRDPTVLNRLLMQTQAPQQIQATPQQTPFDQAAAALNLTPQEKYLYQYHLNNLGGPGQVVQPNGDISTVLQTIVTGPDGRYYNIPTVWGGKELSPPEAAQQAEKVGWDKWPAYATPDAADARYDQMHGYMDQDVGAYLKKPKSGGQ